MPIPTVGGVTSTISGEVILIMHQYAYHPKYATIHSSAQIEYYKNVVDDRSIKVGGSQHITALYGYIIPISIRSTLSHMPMGDDSNVSESFLIRLSASPSPFNSL